jgi:hypothetical protein
MMLLSQEPKQARQARNLDRNNVYKWYGISTPYFVVRVSTVPYRTVMYRTYSSTVRYSNCSNALGMSGGGHRHRLTTFDAVQTHVIPEQA